MDVEEDMNENILFGGVNTSVDNQQKNEQTTPHMGSTYTAQFNDQQASIMSEEISGTKPNTRTMSIDGDPFEIAFGAAKTYQEDNCTKKHLSD